MRFDREFWRFIINGSMPKNLNLSYPAILKYFGDYKAKGRTPSKAFIAWFLETYYRLDPIDVDDSISDGPGDKGIDAIYVSELWRQIHVFGCRMFEGKKARAPLGDPEIKELLGTLTQLKSEPDARKLQDASDTRPELRKLMERLEVVKRIGEGFEVRGSFVTNRARGKHAQGIVDANPSFQLFDSVELKRQFLPIDKVDPIAGPTQFNIRGVGVLKHEIEPGISLVVAPLLASDLVKMGGLANQELFAWNLRYQLRRSEVNKAIEISIASPKEHKHFPAFHNGLTVLAEKVDVTPDNNITIKGYAVVNGCQSLTALYQQQGRITPELRILTKFVAVSPKSQIALKITDHTNRQNGITGRDLQSNNQLQTRLQTEIHRRYSGEYFYRISRGEHMEWPPSKVIENDAMARILLAFDCKEPQSSHQIYKLFEELHSKIFGRKEVCADRVVALWEIHKVVEDELAQMENKSFGRYSQTPFLVLHLLREVLETSASGGASLCRDGSMFLSKPSGMARLLHSIRPTVKCVVNNLGGYLKMHPEDFDYKKDLKSATKVKDIAAHVTTFYKQCVDSKYARPFSDAWSESANIRAGRAFSGELPL